MNPTIPKKVFYGLLAIILLLLLLHTTSFLGFYYGKFGMDYFFFDNFSFNQEKNVPSIFSSILHLTACILLAKVGFSQWIIKTTRWFWWLMSFVFFFLGMDELLRIHEMIRGNSSPMEASGTFLYAWIAVYGSAMIVLGAIIFKPLMELPRKTLFQFLIAGFIFVFGAFGLENIVGLLTYHQGIETEMVHRLPSLFVISTLEESLEMIGISYFIFSILDFMRTYSLKEIEFQHV